VLTNEQLQELIDTGDTSTLTLVNQYLDAQDKENATKSFKAFVRLFWGISTTSPLVDGWYLDALCEHLQHLPEIKRLLINIPPRHGKSTLCAVLLPAWLWINRPQTRFLCSSYSLQLSLRDSVYCRQVIESPKYQRFFPQVKLLSDQNTKGRFNTTKGGYRLATSIDSGNTGEGADVLIADDLNDVSRIHSPAERQSVINWWSQVMSTRMNPGGMDCRLVIQQRCHEEDISGYIMANDPEHTWTRLILPWEYEPDRKTTTFFFSDPREIPGEALSDLLTPEKIEELKGGNGLGVTGFATQFQQRPAPAQGATFIKDWFRYFHETASSYFLDGVEIKKEWCRKFVTTDLAISLKTTADWTVAQTWAITPHGHLLLVDQFRARIEGPEAIKEFERICQRHNPDAIHVEDVAFQKMFYQLLKQKNLPAKLISPQGHDKKARSQRAQVKAECGMVWIPEGRDWVAGWLEEVCAFPNGAKDDQVDAFSYAGIISAKYPVKPLPVEKTPEEKAKEIEQKRNRFLFED
jgi:predicted phage terminase large subunit-like protein